VIDVNRLSEVNRLLIDVAEPFLVGVEFALDAFLLGFGQFVESWRAHPTPLADTECILYSGGAWQTFIRWFSGCTIVLRSSGRVCRDRFPFGKRKTRGVRGSAIEVGG